MIKNYCHKQNVSVCVNIVLHQHRLTKVDFWNEDPFDQNFTMHELFFRLVSSKPCVIEKVINLTCYFDRLMQAKTWKISCDLCPVWMNSWQYFTPNTGKCSNVSWRKEVGNTTGNSLALTQDRMIHWNLLQHTITQRSWKVSTSYKIGYNVIN